LSESPSSGGAEEKIRLALRTLPVLAVGQAISNGSNGYRSLCLIIKDGSENVKEVREILFKDKNLNVYGFGYPVTVPKRVGDRNVGDDYDNVWEISFHV